MAQMGMGFADRGGVVTPPMVTASKNRDRVHMRCNQRLGELSGIEIRPNIGNVLGGVEIQMDLSRLDCAHRALSSNRGDRLGSIGDAQADQLLSCPP